jgi:hypothetical protein
MVKSGAEAVEDITNAQAELKRYSINNTMKCPNLLSSLRIDLRDNMIGVPFKKDSGCPIKSIELFACPYDFCHWSIKRRYSLHFIDNVRDLLRRGQPQSSRAN